MNQILQDFARYHIKANLAKLPENNQMIFKRMYSPNNLDANINDVVDSLDESKLDWAMQQVQRTLDK